MLEMVLELLGRAGADLSVEVHDDEVRVTVQDFEGFDEHWSEIDRELDDEALVEDIQEELEELCVAHDGDYYHYYDFEGFTVVWGYASMDI